LITAKDNAEKSDRLKTAFLNNISHEIRTPLNAILGFVPFILDKHNSDEEKREYLEIVDKSSKRLLQTVTDYMDISLLTSANMDTYIKLFSPFELINELFEEFQTLCIRKKILLLISVPSVLKTIQINTDKLLLKKIFKHLINNALKFTKKGKIILGIEIKDKTLQFFVKDTGKGIIFEAQSFIFNPFMQEDNSNTRGYEGSGLGLSIVKEATKLLGGCVRVDSIKDKGSSFYLEFPYESTIKKQPKKSALKFSKIKKPRPLILIAEDDMSNYLYFKSVLKTEAEIIRAENGLEAVELCRKNTEIDIVLMDIKMPIINGIDATIEIKKIRKNLPIIVLTAHSDIGDHSKCIEAGCDDYIAKPVKSDKLLALCHKYYKTENLK